MTSAGHLHAVWSRVYAFARSRSKLVPRLTLKVGCPAIARHRRTDPRAFMHTGGQHAPGQVHASPEAAKLPIQFIVGLLVHEIGHPLATRVYSRSEQEDADSACLKILGVKIRYGGPLIIEYVSPSDLRRILGSGVAANGRAPTMKDVNKRLAQYGIELVKGSGYFYFWPFMKEDDHPIMLASETSVMLYRFSDQTPDEWVTDAIELIKEGLDRTGRTWEQWVAKRGAAPFANRRR